jgi:hypothetical protein
MKVLTSWKEVQFLAEGRIDRAEICVDRKRKFAFRHINNMDHFSLHYGKCTDNRIEKIRYGIESLLKSAQP